MACPFEPETADTSYLMRPDEAEVSGLLRRAASLLQRLELAAPTRGLDPVSVGQASRAVHLALLELASMD